MFRARTGEEWRTLTFKQGRSPNKNYAVSSHGRIAAFTDELYEGRLLKGGIIGGYPSLKIRIGGKDKTHYVHKLVGKYFVEGQSEACDRLIHCDYDKRNNHMNNLKWVDKETYLQHQRKNPAVIEAKRKQAEFLPEVGHKLTSTDVMRIKKKIWDPERKTRLRMIAKQFGISEMQLYRIKSGENWSHVRVANEPEHTLRKKH
ncbi:MAG: hypothetical protein HWD92_00625 [Flavobacteriia bacterium]|nr:hypothetical protein [Flavobacteriia bacterium]